MSRTCLRAIALALALALASCGSDAKPPPTSAADVPLRIGTKNFTESEILGELYRQALEAKGVPVELQSAVGPTEVINLALREGQLDMYPEYIGVLLSEVDKIRERPTQAAAAYRLAKGLEERRSFTLLNPTRLSNENALAVTRSFSRRRGVRSIADLKGLHPAPRLGAAPEFLTRFEGMIGLRSRYGLTRLKSKLVDPNTDLRYAALDSGKIDVASVFTTDSQLASGRYTLLKDPKGVFDKQHVAPIISRKALARYGPELPATLNAVSALLTTPVMRQLNAQADGKTRRSPAQIAGAFLSSHGLK